MAKDIERIIDDFVVPEMEYSAKYDKLKTKGPVGVTIDDIPEVVLPKTKAEVYNEAKGRLNQKTSAVSGRALRKQALQKPEVAAIASPVESQATVQIGSIIAEHSIADTTIFRVKTQMFTRPVDDPIWVGSAQELVPFAWRNPLIPDISRPSKFYRLAVKGGGGQFLPVPHDK